MQIEKRSGLVNIIFIDINYMNNYYDYFLTLVIIVKTIYLFDTIALRVTKAEDPSYKNLDAMTLRNDQLFVISEGLMYVLLLIIFRPSKNKDNIVINRHEQIIFFVLGILGLAHTNWSILT